MEIIIKKLLNESSYIEKTGAIPFYSKEDKSFFFIINIAETDFITLNSKELIKENSQYKAAMDGFKTIVNSGDQITIEKNSSLIVLVNCSNIDAIGDLQQQILLIEEDQYFFKKYVILYTEASISGLTATPLIPELRTKVKDNTTFNVFARKGYQSDIAEYLVIMQLFIKLPFLNLVYNKERFTSLSQKLTSILSAEASLYASLVSHSEELAQVDFSKPEDEAKINELLSILSHD
ncbi:ABC-three component system middle component 1 [Albibacterium bauzanense]|uniref:Uncharacterized protein n=1 Tax=Albibacterium bauzanense TaxID=653929 RepID=A0A4R1M059_9SPHI|nr:ABC-three component system middle component 1 [Albibacterium bauzanense]TCK82909.1 hypothetical protein C8N28_1495 [Albibacterium bauzanense]